MDYKKLVDDWQDKVAALEIAKSNEKLARSKIDALFGHDKGTRRNELGGYTVSCSKSHTHKLDTAALEEVYTLLTPLEKSALSIKYAIDKKVYDQIPVDKRELLDDLIETIPNAPVIKILKGD